MKYFDVTWANSEAEMNDQARMFGMLIAWAIENKLVADEPDFDEEREVEYRVMNRTVDSGLFFADICYDFCDGKICDQDFNDVGNRFMKQYIELDIGQFRRDYDSSVANHLAPDSDSWDNYQLLVPVLDRRLRNALANL
ncbi:MAG: hypothetical protein WEA31_06080 [Pirellulales bacterium]